MYAISDLKFKDVGQLKGKTVYSHPFLPYDIMRSDNLMYLDFVIEIQEEDGPRPHYISTTIPNIVSNVILLLVVHLPPNAFTHYPEIMQQVQRYKNDELKLIV